LTPENLLEGEDDTPMSISASTILMDDFLTAVKYIEPSSRREGFSTVPSQTWEDVGSLETIKARLEQAVCLPIRRADLFAKLNKDTVMHGNDGVLLYGPPGCGKTLLAKAVANASGASFISVKGPELLNKYVGESERAVRQVFERARISPPCVIFFDEMDALCPRRDGSSGSSGATERVVNQMLTEMDGAGESNRGVIVIGATNRPDMVDPAMLRPGRLGLLMYVPLPDGSARANILKTLLRKTVYDPEINFEQLGRETPRFSGADMACLVRSAITQAVVRLDTRGGPALVTNEDFDKAKQTIRASVSEDEEKKYLALRDSIEIQQGGFTQ
jgi:ribosome biogenesis ATPase